MAAVAPHVITPSSAGLLTLLLGRVRLVLDEPRRGDARPLLSLGARLSAESALHDDDTADVDAARGGDHDAFARLVRRHTPAVTQLMRRFTRDPLLLEELVQDAFVEVHKSLPRFRGDAPFLHYLRRIGTRVGYRFWTRRNQAPPTTSDDVLAEVATDDRRPAAHDDAEWVHATLARLQPRDRLVLTLVYLEGCSMAEVAELTEWSVAMAKTQAHRARKRLAALLEEDER